MSASTQRKYVVFLPKCKRKKPSTEKVSNLLAVLKFSVQIEKSQSLLPETHQTKLQIQASQHVCFTFFLPGRGPERGAVGVVGWAWLMARGSAGRGLASERKRTETGPSGA